MKFAVDKVLNLWPLCLSESVTFLNDRLSLNMIMPIFHACNVRFQRVEDAETILFLSKAKEHLFSNQFTTHSDILRLSFVIKTIFSSTGLEIASCQVYCKAHL